MADVLFTAPATEPVTLTEAKAHLRVDVNTDDTLISSLISAAREYCEEYQGRAIITQTREYWLDAFPAGSVLTIPRGPLASVTHVKYYDADGTEGTMTDTDYFVDTKSPYGSISLVSGATWPTGTLRSKNGVVIRYVCGAATSDARSKQAILMLVGHWYENRETVGTASGSLEFSVRALLDQRRLRWWK